MTNTAAYAAFTSNGYATSATNLNGLTIPPVTMRVAPTALEQTGTASNYSVASQAFGSTCSAVPSFTSATPYVFITAFTASGLTSGFAGIGRADAATGAYLGWSAEL